MMTQAEQWWTVAGAALAVALAAGLADWRRGRRRDIDRVGWVPWTLIQIVAVTVVLGAAAVAVHS